MGKHSQPGSAGSLLRRIWARKLWRAVIVLGVLALGAGPVVAQSWYGDGYGDGYRGGRDRYYAYAYGGERARPYNDGYIRSGLDWPRPWRSRDDGYAPRRYGCSVRHVYYDPDLDRYTVVHRPAPCREDYYSY